MLIKQTLHIRFFNSLHKHADLLHALSVYHPKNNRPVHFKNTALLWLLVCLFIATTACTSANTELFPEHESERPIPVILRSHGWHVGLLVPVNEQFTELMPPGLHLGRETHAYAELGWGDRNYYMSPDPGLWSTMKAALWPTTSVLHVAGYAELPRMPSGSGVRVMLSEAGYHALLHHAASYFEIPEAAGTQTIWLDEGLYGDARFYASGRRYYFPKTSNRWVAGLLQEAGVPINRFTALSAGTLMHRSLEFGQAVQNSGQ